MSALRDALTDYKRQLNRMAEQLYADVPPNHVDYISKPDAGDWALVIASEIGKLLRETHP